MHPAFQQNIPRQRNPATSLDSEVAAVIDGSVRSFIDPLIGRFWRCMGSINHLFCPKEPDYELEEWVVISVKDGEIKQKSGQRVVTPDDSTPPMIEFD